MTPSRRLRLIERSLPNGMILGVFLALVVLAIVIRH